MCYFFDRNFGEFMCYFSNRKFANFERKENQYRFFHNLIGARQHSQTSSEKNHLALIVIMLQFINNLWLKNFFDTKNR